MISCGPEALRHIVALGPVIISGSLALPNDFLAYKVVKVHLCLFLLSFELEWPKQVKVVNTIYVV